MRAGSGRGGGVGLKPLCRKYTPECDGKVNLIICALERKVRCPLLPSLEDIALYGGTKIVEAEG
jgi:hypothetical protein